jgi:DNA polymerase-3 subunit epsilon
VHEINDEMLAAAPRWISVWPKVEKVLDGRLVCVYNAEFDQRMFRQTHRKYKIRWFLPEGTSFFCVMRLYAQFYGEWNAGTGEYRWQSLDNAIRQCKIPLTNAHRSTLDCLRARAILHYMAESLNPG